jgi:Xaa-Pro aminopeptidase
MRFGKWVIKENDSTAVKFDFGASWEGYHSDMNRRIYVGEPPKEWIDRVEADARLCDIIVGTIRPGMTAREVHAAGRDAIVREYGIEILTPPAGEEFTFMHSIGLKGHEEPIVAFGEPAELHDACLKFEVNTVFDLEPTWIEDMFVVKENGVERLTTLPRQLFTV